MAYRAPQAGECHAAPSELVATRHEAPQATKCHAAVRYFLACGWTPFVEAPVWPNMLNMSESTSDDN